MNEEIEKYGWWDVKFNITLESQTTKEIVRFEDLSESTREHIAKQIFEGITSGQICEID